MKCLAFLLLSLYISLSYGQSPYRAPLNPDFLKQDKKTGYVHPPYKVSHERIKMKDAGILPSHYDLRNDNGETYTPAIRNQSPHGACWTFAAMASIETSWRKAGDAAFTDLSEANMAKCHGYEFDIDSGGNHYMATAYLTSHAGPLYESADPYTNIAARLCPNVDPKTDIPAYIDEVLWLGNDPQLIKRIIYNYGAVATSMLSDFSSKYYNSSDYTFFYNGESGVDHGVTIVGWDDNKVVTGGSEGSPTAPGAWIVRNSWGAGAQDQGYFYASYEDLHIGKECELYHGKTNVNEVDVLFDYAKAGAITSYSTGSINGNVAYAAVKYHSDKDLFVTHIGSALLSEGITLDVAICRTFDGSSFSDTIAYSSGNLCYYSGYKKLELPALVEAGDFYLLVKYESPNNSYPLPAEAVVQEYVVPEIEEGKMWISNDGEVWNAGGLNTLYDFDLAAKVYAKYLDGLQPYFTKYREKACIDQTITFYNNTIGEADSFIWQFQEDTLSTLLKSDTVNISFSESGIKSLSLVAYKDGIPTTFTKSNAIEVVSYITPKILVAKSADYYSKGKNITFIGSGGDSYRWYAEGYLNGESGTTMTFAPNEDEIWVRMETAMGQCFASDSVLIKMVEVPYDDIADALELSIGMTVENISNLYASVQEGEPLPPIGSCSSQNTWCEEGGLQNSIWFKFLAPNSGMASVTSTGFDNQLALYDATATGTWQDIMSGNPDNYTIIAANDDYHSDDYSAKIQEVSGLTPNKTYWIQMDGSAGGSTGKIRITVNTSVTTIHSIGDKELVNITNSPRLFLIQGEQTGEMQISIYTSTGQQILNSTVNSLVENTKAANIEEGFYIIRLQNEDYDKTFKAIAGPQWEIRYEER